MHSQNFTITPEGPFSLAQAAQFGFGQRPGGEWDGVMRLAFCLDGYREQVAVEVRQDAKGVVQCTLVKGTSDTEAAQRQVSRVLSLDHDGEEFTKIGERDPVIARLQEVAPGLRPPLFYSPYEAAAWCVLSARRPARQMMTIRQRLSETHGQTFAVAGRSVAAFPLPRAVLGIESFPGLSADKIDRLHGVAQAALDGKLDSDRLLAVGPDEAMSALQSIKGIGPFFSSLIAIRGTGFTDVLPIAEPQALSLTAQLYDIEEPLSAERFREIAEPWRPLRTWAIVLIRAVAPRVLDSREAMPVAA